jgi:transcriptional regulator with XRE-family HTH domain
MHTEFLLKRVGHRIQSARIAKKMTLEDVSRAVPGLSASALSNYEHGRREPSLIIFMQLARVLGVDADHLACLDGSTGIADAPADYIEGEVIRDHDNDHKQQHLSPPPNPADDAAADASSGPMSMSMQDRMAIQLFLELSDEGKKDTTTHILREKQTEDIKRDLARARAEITQLQQKKSA